MDLSTLLGQYALARDVSPETLSQYGFAVRSLERFLSRPPTLADLTDDGLNRWIDWLLSRELSRATIKGQRGSLLAIWRFAVEVSLLDRLPLRVKKLRRCLPLPEAYSLRQTVDLLGECQWIQGRFRCGVPRAALLRAWVLVAYYTALRPGDLGRLRWSEISADGVFVVIQRKTGEPLLRRLPADAMAAVLATDPGSRELVFPIGQRVIRYWWGQIRKAAGVKGSPKWMRRSSATAVEAIQPGAAMRHLGHRTPGLAARHYIDPRLLGGTGPLPPRIA